VHVLHAFRHYFGICGKEGKLPDQKKILAIIHMLTQKHLRTFKFSMAWHNTTNISLRILLSLWLPSPSYYEKRKLLNGRQNANRLGKKSSNITLMH
jgi:hypothetical protein